MRHTLPLALVCGLATTVAAQDGAPAPAERGGESAMMIDDGLIGVSGSIISISDRGVVLIDEAGRRVSRALSDLTALLITRAPVRAADGIGAAPPPDSDDTSGVERILRRLRATPAGVLETVDGQRFPGAFSTTAGQDDAIVWTHPTFGTLIFPLDDVAAAFRDMEEARRMPEASAAPLDDVLVLTNGDRLRGFVVGLGDPVEIEVDGQMLTIEPSRVSAAILSNPRRSRAGDMVWLEDGTVALIDRFALTEAGVVTVALPDGHSGEYESSSLRALALGVERLVPLSMLVPIEQSPVGGRRTAEPIQRVPNIEDTLTSGAPALGAMDVRMPGPMRIVYDLPPGARRLAMSAMLGDDAGQWGDFELVISIDGRELTRAHLWKDEPVHAINIDASGKRLTITLEPGRFGPIRDTALLARPIILVDRATPRD